MEEAATKRKKRERGRENWVGGESEENWATGSLATAMRGTKEDDCYEAILSLRFRNMIYGKIVMYNLQRRSLPVELINQSNTDQSSRVAETDFSLSRLSSAKVKQAWSVFLLSTSSKVSLIITLSACSIFHRSVDESIILSHTHARTYVSLDKEEGGGTGGGSSRSKTGQLCSMPS